MLDQDSSFYLISLNILFTCLLTNVWILLREVLGYSLLGVKGLDQFITKQVRSNGQRYQLGTLLN